jgi:hypothetical protein
MRARANPPSRIGAIDAHGGRLSRRPRIAFGAGGAIGAIGALVAFQCCRSLGGAIGEPEAARTRADYARDVQRGCRRCRSDADVAGIEVDHHTLDTSGFVADGVKP